MENANHVEEDAGLLQQLCSDSIFAFNALYTKYWAYIYQLAYKRLQDESLSKDVTQDIFLKLWQQRGQLHIDNLPAYLYICTRNQVLKVLEKERKYCPIPTLLQQTSTSPEQSDNRVREKDFLAAYKRLLLELTPAQQNIYRLRYLEDLPTDSIAERLSISRKTVQNQLAYCRHKLKETLLILAVCYLLQITAKNSYEHRHPPRVVTKRHQVHAC